MITGIYQSAMGLDQLSRMQEIVSSNLANISTNGFKQELASVEKNPDGSLNLQLRTDFTHGPVEMTGQPLDVASKNDGLFVVSTAAGTAYTRNGNFTLDAEGRVVTADGCPVQGEHGDIVLGSQQFTLSDRGEFLVNNEVVDRLLVVAPPEELTPLGSALFTSSQPAEPMPEDDVSLLTGALERSNVNLTQAMVDMLAVVRLYEANQKALQSQDETLKQAVSQIGRSA